MANEALGINVHGRQSETILLMQKADWEALSVAPETADNSGNTVVLPAAISRWQKVMSGQDLLVQLKYDDGLTSVTSPVIQCFGRDTNGQMHKLFDRNGTHEITVTVAPTTDVADGTYCYTTPVRVMLDGCEEVLVAIKTALAGTGTVNTSELLVKVASAAEPGGAIGASGSGSGATFIGQTYGDGITVKTNLTRDDNTTNYTAGDVMADSDSAPTTQKFAGAVRVAGGKSTLTKLVATTNEDSAIAGVRLRVHCFKATLATPNDNVGLTDQVDSAHYLGYVDLPGFEADGSRYITESILPFDVTSDTTDVFFIPITRDGITGPTASFIIRFTAHFIFQS